MGSLTLSRRRLIVLGPLLWLAPVSALGAQLTPVLQEGELGVLLRGASLPPTVRKDLSSGLTNRVVIRIALQGAQPALQRLVGIAVKYDLWEETFAVRVSVDDVDAVAMSLRSVDEVVEMLTNLTLPHLFAIDSGVSAGKSLTLTAQILFDPIEKARLEEIRKWVAENDRPVPPDPSSLGSGLPARPSASSRVFNRIFEQFAAGASEAAVWKQAVSSTPFKLEDLRAAR